MAVEVLLDALVVGLETLEQEDKGFVLVVHLLLGALVVYLLEGRNRKTTKTM